MHVADVGEVGHGDGFGGQQDGREYLQRFVLGPLRRDFAAQFVPALNDKFSHALFLDKMFCAMF